ncbi:MAG: hypothetical protein K2K55_10645 [Duncaniella sp.]|nr:hypothetical protein [Duncaniella sp.]
MKLRAILTLLILFLACLGMQATTDGRCFFFSLDKYSHWDDSSIISGGIGTRVPNNHCNCRISNSGLYIYSNDDEILKYEILTEDATMCLYSFPEETEFVEAVFLLESGTYFIQLTSIDYIYIGYLCVE